MVQVRVFWPDGSACLMDHREVRGLKKEVDGKMLRPACILCDADLSVMSAADRAKVTHDLVKCGAYVKPMRVPEVASADDGNSVSETVNRDRTQKVVSASRQNYLIALATHHARVARLAVEMSKFTRRESWNYETLELMAEMIESSFIEAFGTEIKPKPDGVQIRVTEYKQHAILQRLLDDAICNDVFVESFFRSIMQVMNYGRSNYESCKEILVMCFLAIPELSIAAKLVIDRARNTGEIIPWRCPNDTDGDGDCLRCSGGQCPLRKPIPGVCYDRSKARLCGVPFIASSSLISEDMANRCVMDEEKRIEFMRNSSIVHLIEHGVKIVYFSHPDGSILIKNISPAE